MVNVAIPEDTDSVRSGLLEQIEREKNERIAQQSPRDMRLTEDCARMFLSKSCLLKHEVMALLQGVAPDPSFNGAQYAYLDPDLGEEPVAQRFLSDEKVGTVAYPIRIEELVERLLPWSSELPEVVQIALESRRPESAASRDLEKASSRKNSAAFAIIEVDRCMNAIVALLRAVGRAPDGKEGMPGTKRPYNEYLRKHSIRLAELGDESISDYLSHCGYRWRQSGGGGATIDTELRQLFGLRQVKPQEKND